MHNHYLVLSNDFNSREGGNTTGFFGWPLGPMLKSSLIKCSTVDTGFTVTDTRWGGNVMAM